MKRTLLLFQWDKPSAQARAKVLRAAGWTVSIEFEDGALGGSRVLRQQPTVVVMDLAKRPSHSRETAGGIRGYKAGREIPILFVDGTNDDIAKTKAKVPNAIFTVSNKLEEALEKIIMGKEN
jgi:CheY-like chemotaxis protein